MGKAIPDRWLDYTPIGERIAGTRFIAFKVPLRQNINEDVDEKLRLAPHSLLESVPNLAMIVDLTNTSRYYNPQTFVDLNVSHQKLMIPGHFTPPKALAERFCDYVSEFLDANAHNDNLIGVHCTHGVNRTGYLICYFMITKMKMSPELAMRTFADARGHPIERENYTNSLLDLQGKSTQEPEAAGKRERINSPRDRHCDEKQIWRHPQQYDRSEDNWRNRSQDQGSYKQQQRKQRHIPRQSTERRWEHVPRNGSHHRNPQGYSHYQDEGNSPLQKRRYFERHPSYSSRSNYNYDRRDHSASYNRHKHFNDVEHQA